jgi:hypothetical protein
MAAVLVSEPYKCKEIKFPLSAARIQHMLSDICIVCLPYFSLNSVINELLMDLLNRKVTAIHRNSLVANSILHLT